MKLAYAAIALAAGSASAQASVTISSTPGSASYAGPAPTYDFETAAPITGGAVRTGSLSGITAQPLGSTGNYWAIGPSNGGTGFLDLSSFSAISAISFLWGSADAFNWLDVLDRGGAVLATFNGLDVAAGANGSWTAESGNPLASLSITGADRTNIGGLRLRATNNAFEVDNFAIGAIPEPATWAMLVLGFGVLGGAMRGRSRKAGQMRQALSFA